jgi:hypothetical protein
VGQNVTMLNAAVLPATGPGAILFDLARCVVWPFDAGGVFGMGFSTRRQNEGHKGPRSRSAIAADETPRVIA